MKQTIGCDQCTGVMKYRVRFENMPNPADNFDQLVDHMPLLFTSPTFLKTVFEGQGTVMVEQLPEVPWESAITIAFAGPAEEGGRTWWCENRTEAVAR